MSEEENDAMWYCAEILADNKNDIEHWKIIENLIDKLQKELEEKTTILMAGADKVKQLEKENEELRDTNKKLYEMGLQRAVQELLNENWVNKDDIREFIKKELPDDEIMECCSNYDVNGVAIRKELEKLL